MFVEPPAVVPVNPPPTKTDQHPCPICGSRLFPLRGNWRCGRCGFGLCVGCEPEGAYCDVVEAGDR